MKSVPIPLGDYQPDLAELVNNGLSKASNTVPIPGGYGKVDALAAISAFSAAPDRVRGSIAGIDDAGNPFIFAGTEATLQAMTSSTADVTRATGGAYSCGGDLYWEFSRFSQYIIGVCGSDDPQYFDLNWNPVHGVEKFRRLGNPDTTNTVAPRASHIGQIGTFIVLGAVEDAINGYVPNAIQWPAVNDPFNWPAPGSEVAGAVLSGRSVLAGDGGAVQRITTGTDVGAIFQESAIWRADFRGGDTVFDFNIMDSTKGLLIPAICVPFGQHIFYLSEEGFNLFDYTMSAPIGQNIIDSTFLADVDTAYFDRVSAARHPSKTEIWVLYPGSGNVDGVPNKYLVYNWVLQRFAHGELDAHWISHVIEASLDLDAVGTADDPDEVDTVGLPSFDVRQAAPGALKLGAFDTSDQVSDFGGAGRGATLETGRRSLVPDYRSLTSTARLQVSSDNPEMQVRGQSESYEPSRKWGRVGTKNTAGRIPLRQDALHHEFRIILAAGWDKVLSFDLRFDRTGGR